MNDKEQIFEMITRGVDINEERFSTINDLIQRLRCDLSACNRRIDTLSVSVKILKDKVNVLENNDD